MRIWGIGLNKTGVTSLAEALRLLGYRTKKIIVPTQLNEVIAGTDMPVAMRYKELDRKYPKSKFILTTRHADSPFLGDWLRSCELQWQRAKFPELAQNKPFVALEIATYRTYFFGSYRFDRKIFIEAYWEHYKGVLSYFMHRQGDLLIVDVCNHPNPFIPICQFLGKNTPDSTFPHLNRYQ